MIDRPARDLRSRDHPRAVGRPPEVGAGGAGDQGSVEIEEGGGVGDSRNLDD
jgi:hypothetical protein